MGDAPWQGDACSLVDAFRRGERSPVEELDATLAAIEASALNAFCFQPAEAARTAAANADLSRPFGGVPIGVKELDHVTGWPATHASVLFADEVAGHTSTLVDRLAGPGGAVLAGQTTASEFGGVNVTRTVLHGATRQPLGRHPDPGRLLGRERCRGGRWAGLPGHRQRRRRLDPDPGRLHRAGRAEGDLRPHPAWTSSGDRQLHDHHAAA